MSGFDDWMAQVDKVIEAVYGLSVNDLPDCPFADWYEDGITPVSAAGRAIAMAD